MTFQKKKKNAIKKVDRNINVKNDNKHTKNSKKFIKIKNVYDYKSIFNCDGIKNPTKNLYF